LNNLLKLGIKMGVLSDAPVKEAWLRLAFLNFQHTFDAVVTFDDTGERKPSAAPFKKYLSDLK
jgi:putative hydrolase of the HAD superfamily